ncbi:hypothetical protein T492DRAFT_831377 [Pavlovales sp. CCMP2436]|nr:hypothetical protein T492DRAFT_831377 [Pavlovales sp. CCMP2436]
MVSVRATLRVGISSAPMRTELHLDTGGQLAVSVFGLKFVNDVNITEVGHGLFDTHFVADEPEDLLEVFEVMKDPGTNFTFKQASATLSWARPRWGGDAKWCSGSAIALKSRATPGYTPVVDELTLDIEVRLTTSRSMRSSRLTRTRGPPSSGEVSMERLGVDEMCIIARMLRPSDLRNLALTCKQFRIAPECTLCTRTTALLRSKPRIAHVMEMLKFFCIENGLAAAAEREAALADERERVTANCKAAANCKGVPSNS